MFSRIVADIGASLDWVYDLTMKNKWDVLKLNIGPGMYQFVGMHPDVMKVMLRSGGWVGSSS